MSDLLPMSIAQTVRDRLTLPGLREESVKLSASGITRGRYLLSFSRRALLPGPSARLQALAADLRLDPNPLLPHVGLANAVHIGAEADGRAKLYLEFPPPNMPEPGLAFLAVKHDSQLNRYLLTDQAAAILSDQLRTGPVLETALACLPFGGVTLHVVEEDSPRSSIDIHLADADMKLGDLPGLDVLLEPYQDKLTDVQDEVLGHFAAGIGRDGQAFCTIYYGGRHDP